MKNILYIVLSLVFLPISLVGQTINNFSVDGFNLASHSSKKAVVVVFTSSHCKFATQYINRLNQLYNRFGSQGVSFVAVNSNDATMNPDDDPNVMRIKAIYSFAYIKDNDQALAKMFGATKNPEAFILVPSNGSFSVVYKGQIDDNPLDENLVHSKSLENGIQQVLNGQALSSAGASMGCPIRMIR